MNVNEMRIAEPGASRIAGEAAILDELLPLAGAMIVELGCGKAEKTRVIAGKAASVLAFEVDEIQLAKNRALTDLANVRFEHGGAERIAAEDAAFDIALMFKSLHHVPVAQMDEVFSEIERVLKPGGLAYISEPVYAGDFNEILRLFHDEKIVREAAFAAEMRAVSSGILTLLSQNYFLQPMHFENFSQFDEQVIRVTHTNHRLSAERYQEVRSRFDRHMTANGVDFHMPIRVDLFKKHRQ